MRVAPPTVSGPGMALRETSDGITVSAVPSGIYPVRQFWARIRSTTAQPGPNQWVYAWDQAIKTDDGYGGWRVKQEGRNSDTLGVAYNLAENQNGESGIQGNGIDIDGPDFQPGSECQFALQPAPAGLIVLMSVVNRADGEAREFWFYHPNAVDRVSVEEPG